MTIVDNNTGTVSEMKCYELEVVTQSKSKTQIARSVHCKFNCITVKYNGTEHNNEMGLLNTGMVARYK